MGKTKPRVLITVHWGIVVDVQVSGILGVDIQVQDMDAKAIGERWVEEYSRLDCDTIDLWENWEEHCA